MVETNSYIKLSLELQQLIGSEEANHFRIVPKSSEAEQYVFYVEESRKGALSGLKRELELIYGKDIGFSPLADEIFNKTLSIYFRKGNQEDEIAEVHNEFLDNLIIGAKKIGASDVHIETYDKNVRVRLRIDGKLIEKNKLEKKDYAELINQIKIKAKLDITEKRLPQDGRITYENFDLRVSILPTHYGEKVVLRILGKDASQLDINSLGFEEKDLAVYKNAIQKPNGIILISGPTGSGKTTTLYATLKLINTIERNIVTVEDPIEYTLEGVNQVQLKENIGLDFTSALKSFLRQDPDIIMLGEIRDAQTAQMAIRASLTGHLVLSTIHTNSAAGTISRLQDMGVPSFLISETINISLAQRLVRLLCSGCKKKIAVDKTELPEKFRQSAPAEQYISQGCSQCHYTGYTGRQALYELLPIDSAVSKLIKENKNLEDGSLVKMETLSTKAYKLFQKGITSLEEIYPLLLNT